MGEFIQKYDKLAVIDAFCRKADQIIDGLHENRFSGVVVLRIPQNMDHGRAVRMVGEIEALLIDRFPEMAED